MPLGEAAARVAGRFLSLREADGRSAHTSDMMIAGIVATISASLATRNVKDFESLSIKIIDPWNRSGG